MCIRDRFSGCRDRIGGEYASAVQGGGNPDGFAHFKSQGVSEKEGVSDSEFRLHWGVHSDQSAAKTQAATNDPVEIGVK